MQDMRSIAENIGSIRKRRQELAALKPVDRGLAEELSDLEARASLFAETCVRHHRINLCQAGFVYGDVLRHPADPDVAVSVRLGDRVEAIEGLDAPAGEITIAAATALLGARVGRGLAFRDWHAGGRSLGQREDDLLMNGPRGAALRSALDRLGPPAMQARDVPDRTETASDTTGTVTDTATAPAVDDIRTTPASQATARTQASRPRRSRSDDQTPDLFG
jgi:hypothetical protein